MFVRVSPDVPPSLHWIGSLLVAFYCQQISESVSQSSVCERQSGRPSPPTAGLALSPRLVEM